MKQPSANQKTPEQKIKAMAAAMAAFVPAPNASEEDKFTGYATVALLAINEL